MQGLFADRRLSVLEVQMQVSPMNLVGLGSHDRREYLAAAVMRSRHAHTDPLRADVPAVLAGSFRADTVRRARAQGGH